MSWRHLGWSAESWPDPHEILEGIDAVTCMSSSAAAAVHAAVGSERLAGKCYSIGPSTSATLVEAVFNRLQRLNTQALMAWWSAWCGPSVRATRRNEYGARSIKPSRRWGRRALGSEAGFGISVEPRPSLCLLAWSRLHGDRGPRLDHRLAVAYSNPVLHSTTACC